MQVSRETRSLPINSKKIVRSCITGRVSSPEADERGWIGGAK